MSAESPALPPRSHLTPKEITVFLRVNQRTVYRLCEDGELPSVQWRHVIRIPRDRFLLWYEQRGKGFIG
jgi:excisionase family DNA binding protein